MQLRRSADTVWYRTALTAALAAMCLLLLGPIISQSQSGAAHHAPHGEGHRYTAQHTQHAPSPPPADHTAGHHHHAADQASLAAKIEPIFHWFHQCGYCSLWQQFPSAHASLPAIGKQAFIAHSPPIKHSPQEIPPCDHYPHALTRAPPRVISA